MNNINKKERTKNQNKKVKTRKEANIAQVHEKDMI
jgi:hypothetical protein